MKTHAELKHDTYGRLPSAQNFQRPGFWSKRRKTAVSLFSVIALLAGIAVAFKLFDRTVGDNVVRDAAVFNFEVSKFEAANGDTDYIVAPPGRVFADNAGQYPGDTRSVDVRIKNLHTQPARDASFQVYITNIRVTHNGTTEPVGSLNWNRFVSFWTFSADREQVLATQGGDVLVADGNYTQTCSGGIREITAAAPCNLALIRAAGKTDAAGNRTDVRDYRFKLTELDDGTDQSLFKGWAVVFDLVFQARVPAVPPTITVAGFR